MLCSSKLNIMYETETRLLTKLAMTPHAKKVSKIQRSFSLSLAFTHKIPPLATFEVSFNIQWEFHNVSNVFSSFLGAIRGPSASDVNVGDMFFTSLQYNILIYIFLCIIPLRYALKQKKRYYLGIFPKRRAPPPTPPFWESLIQKNMKYAI